ncbi:MAG: DMT family transporter [Promicromonosporaceae bacterium]|nr:DMT family transporter [Promicromonosporaceae bacterium]
MSATESKSRFDRLKALFVLAAFGAGLVSALQSHVNGSFTSYLNAPLAAAEPRNGIVVAVISFASAALILTAMLACVPKARQGVGRVWASLRAGRLKATDADKSRHPGVAGIGRLRWFQVIGGAAGGLFVASQSITVGALGISMFVVATTAGQSVSSLFCDRLGFAPGGQRPITVFRAIGPALAISAILVAQWTRLGNLDQWYLLALPIIAGVCVAAQHAVNGRVETTAATDIVGDHTYRLSGALSATFINFVVGTIALAVVAAIALAVSGLPTTAFPGQWWMYTGGVLGALFIGTAAAVVHKIGVLLLALSLIAGQISGGVLLDVTVRGQDLPLTSIIAVALTFCAVAVPASTTRAK